jgi:Ribbon-helix-helix domain
MSESAAVSIRREPLSKTSFKLPPALLAELREASERTDISQAALVRRGIKLALRDLQEHAA